MSSLKKNLESFKGGNADSNKRDMKAIQRCWKRMKLQTKKKFDEQWRERKKTGGGKAPASPNAISKLLLTVFQRPDNSLVIDDTDEPGPSVQCSMPSTSLSQDRKRTAKRKKKVKVSVVE